MIDINNERIKSLNKRIDEIKWSISLIITSGGVLLALILGLLTFNFSSEIQELRRFKEELNSQVKEKFDEIETRLGTRRELAKIELFTLNNEPLENETIEGKILADDEGYNYLVFEFITINKGKTSTGEYQIKLYTDQAIEFPNISTDEPDYEYEEYLPPETNDIKALVPGFSLHSNLSTYPININNMEKGVYPIMMKFFYSGTFTTARFKLEIK